MVPPILPKLDAVLNPDIAQRLYGVRHHDGQYGPAV